MIENLRHQKKQNAKLQQYFHRIQSISSPNQQLLEIISQQFYPAHHEKIQKNYRLKYNKFLIIQWVRPLSNTRAFGQKCCHWSQGCPLISLLPIGIILAQFWHQFGSKVLPIGLTVAHWSLLSIGLTHCIKAEFQISSYPTAPYSSFDVLFQHQEASDH